MFGNFFSGGNSNSAQTTTTNSNNQNTGNLSPTNIPNNQPTNTQQQTTQTAEPTTPPAPLANYADLWKAPETQQQTGISDIFNIDETKLTAAAKQIDFTKALTPELVEQIKAGGPEAMGAVLQAMSNMSQHTFANNAAMTARLIQAALEKVSTRYDQRVEELIRSNSVRNQLSDTNPIFSNPAAKPMVDMLTGQFQTRYPQANPAEIKSMVVDYLQNFASLINPNSNTSNQGKSGKKEMDWGAFIS